jgi:hypothetical protein
LFAASFFSVFAAENAAFKGISAHGSAYPRLKQLIYFITIKHNLQQNAPAGNPARLL